MLLYIDSTQQSGGSLPSTAALPHPRQSALRPGSRMEDMIRRHVEDELLNISRRYVKKFSQLHQSDTAPGFTNFTQVAEELDKLVNILWQSGTPSLQIPFLLKLAVDFTQYVRSFPGAPKPSLALLGKMDHCFASLVTGQDIDSHEALPGFENGLRAGMSTTDMVRCRSLAEQTRLLMVEILGSGDEDDEDDDDGSEQDCDDDDDPHDNTDDKYGVTNHTTTDIDQDRIHLAAARVYENTIIQLDNKLGEASFSQPSIASS